MNRRFAANRAKPAAGPNPRSGRPKPSCEPLERRGLLSGVADAGLIETQPEPSEVVQPPVDLSYQGQAGDLIIRAQLAPETISGDDTTPVSTTPNPGSTIDETALDDDSVFPLKPDPNPVDPADDLAEVVMLQNNPTAVPPEPETAPMPPPPTPVVESRPPTQARSLDSLISRLFTSKPVIQGRWSPILKLFDVNKPLVFQTWKVGAARNHASE